ncbi:helix-turn-helix transcriptional regulator [Roseinatronobacter alkalisoli]|uniref:LuxR C-terminal-related transcriptional regulator n=1 Tax=Roseinatronobacter alkalisoli TaxID=3028235 RepID=A0ABT5T5D4_9RHOB|nr:LuxR C-terminal-related transcriptional regulator [Roseinatronobacter sp. HJB301]MDD7970331.1 LuxR C-terminal-related transcriptional regulator [Roseinatronobacter sp. HJB301]
MVLIQAIGALFFISEIVMSLLGIERQPIDWQLREMMEIGAAVALIIGLVMSAVLLMQSQIRLGRAEAKLERASSAFLDLMDQRFTGWGLTPAERDVAFFVLKGFSIQEIASFRTTSEGTVKAQTNAIYRKAEVNGRGQLMSLFIDDLIMDAAPLRPDAKTAKP